MLLIYNKYLLENKHFYLLSAEFFSSLGGSFRQERWSRFFLQEHFELHIFHCGSFGKVIQHSFTNVPDLVEKKNEYLQITKPKAGVRSGKIAYLLRVLKHSLLLDILNPFNLILYFKIRKHISSINTNKIVIHCSSPPFYLAVIASLLKKEFNNKIYFWLDMRDLWSLHQGIPGPKLHKKYIEKMVLKKCDFITTVADSLSKRFYENFDCKVDVAYNVATHVSYDLLQKNPFFLSQLSPLLSSNKITITYTGSLPNGYYNLDKFSFFLERVDEVPLIYTNYQFLFVGECNEMLIRVRKLKNLTVVFLPQQKHEMIKNIQLNSDILLFFGFHSHDNQGQMSIKLFEYFETKNFILSLFISPDADIDRIIRLYCGANTLVSDYDSFLQVLNEFLKRRNVLPRMNNNNGKNSLLSDYKRVVEEIKKIAYL